MKHLEISDETCEKTKDLLCESERDISQLDDMIGKKFFFRSVTYHMLGKVESRVGNILELSSSSWVADSGRFMQAIKNGTLSEVEPVGQAYINLSAVVDFFPWKHKLPEEQK